MKRRGSGGTIKGGEYHSAFACGAIDRLNFTFDEKLAAVHSMLVAVPSLQAQCPTFFVGKASASRCT